MLGLAIATVGWLLISRSSAGAAAGLGAGVRVTLDPPAVVREIQKLSELVSVRYVLQRVVGLEEQKVPVGTEKILLFVQAEVLAGMDLAGISAEQVDVPRGSASGVTIRLPQPRIVQISIDDNQTRVWDRSITWWTPWVAYNKDLERQARLSARDSVEKAAIEMGILKQAERNAETAIRGLLQALGVQSVTFVRGS
jgi:hypothetical protein